MHTDPMICTSTIQWWEGSREVAYKIPPPPVIITLLTSGVRIYVAIQVCLLITTTCMQAHIHY